MRDGAGGGGRCLRLSRRAARGRWRRDVVAGWRLRQARDRRRRGRSQPRCKAGARCARLATAFDMVDGHLPSARDRSRTGQHCRRWRSLPALQAYARGRGSLRRSRGGVLSARLAGEWWSRLVDDPHAHAFRHQFLDRGRSESRRCGSQRGRPFRRRPAKPYRRGLRLQRHLRRLADISWMGAARSPDSDRRIVSPAWTRPRLVVVSHPTGA